MQAYQGIHINVVYFNPFTHNLPVDLAIGRHVYDHIAQNSGRTTQATTLDKRLLSVIFQFTVAAH